MKKKIQIGLCLIAIGAICVSCGPDARLDLVGNISGTSPRIDERFADSEKYNAQHPFVTIKAAVEDYRVYVCTDTHITDDATRWQAFIRAYRNDLLCPVALHLGDIVDAQNNFPNIEKSFNAIPHNPLKPDTMMVVAGNHDICFSQWPAFLNTFKTSIYYFIVETPITHQRDLYIMFDTADGTVGSKQLQWLRETLDWADKQEFRHIIAATHTHFFNCDNSQGVATNFTIEETYALLHLFQSHGVDLVLTGHDHHREVTHYKDMTCIIVDSMTPKDKKPGYFVANIADYITYDFIAVE